MSTLWGYGQSQVSLFRALESLPLLDVVLWSGGFADAKMSEQGRTKVRTDTTGPGAGQSKWDPCQALYRKGPASSRLLLEHKPQHLQGYDSSFLKV